MISIRIVISHSTSYRDQRFFFFFFFCFKFFSYPKIICSIKFTEWIPTNYYRMCGTFIKITSFCAKQQEKKKKKKTLAHRIQSDSIQILHIFYLSIYLRWWMSTVLSYIFLLSSFSSNYFILFECIESRSISWNFLPVRVFGFSCEKKKFYSGCYLYWNAINTDIYSYQSSLCTHLC